MTEQQQDQAVGSVTLRAVFDDLIRFETDLWAGIDARLRHDHDVALGIFDTLQVIHRTDGCRVLDIARALSITVGGASQAVDRLVASGRCERTAHPDDRRSVLIALTTAGRELLESAWPTFDDELARRLGGPLGAAGAQAFAAQLTLLRSAQRQLAD
ncbi:MAG: putative MarR family transcriptional regulator [Frondihabitans sp.]|nr:putative MarR family transcriptional regulator [Frondihabitans sp.]